MSDFALARAFVNLDAWLESTRQPGGYGGPVAHWWQNRLQFVGPGLDWRYEGLLIGYTTAYARTRDSRFADRAVRAALDLTDGQRQDGSYTASQFEINPGFLGTPHEAAATLGLLKAHHLLPDRERALSTAARNLDRLVESLWDGKGFNDRPGIRGRVPNKLATLAHAMLAYQQLTGDERYEPFVRSALNDVICYMVERGEFEGAVHQYAPEAGEGDGRFFPYYNARCIPPLVEAATILGDRTYAGAAEAIFGFVDKTMHEDGSWPQIVYTSGRQASWPRWTAGVADILLAYRALEKTPPRQALTRLLTAQLASGAFPTAEGFKQQISQRSLPGRPDYRDLLPVVGWNDKVLRLLSAMLPRDMPLPQATVARTHLDVRCWGRNAVMTETSLDLTITSAGGEELYRWQKSRPWAETHRLLEIR
ncbi:hypothetical protein [Deinococcus yavapaiensis]|uniref:Uncharacterized protein n=1 Tax=Deinococcus yavapaiensis KR-236 TaxID=694435 RepID=A0A318SRE5_9DEIO|nr:hypothetical protein [Deinococcus yavapaiensis]PYE55647.1 hypothetical protein DES52_10210 [Deinococcus yavapaiensis KR-236]